MRFLSAVFVAALAGAGCGRQVVSPPSALPPPLASSGFGKYSLVSVDDRAGVKLLILTNAGWSVKIEVVDGIEPQDAETLSRDGKMGIEALYAHALSPYPGDISKEVSADRRYSPKAVNLEVDGRVCSGYLLYANDRFGYGATTPDSVAYRSLIAWIYCAKRRELYKVRIFAPLHAPEGDLMGAFKAVRCQ